LVGGTKFYNNLGNIGKICREDTQIHNEVMKTIVQDTAFEAFSPK